jgi:hypothetical protein
VIYVTVLVSADILLKVIFHLVRQLTTVDATQPVVIESIQSTEQKLKCKGDILNAI